LTQNPALLIEFSSCIVYGLPYTFSLAQSMFESAKKRQSSHNLPALHCIIRPDDPNRMAPVVIVALS